MDDRTIQVDETRTLPDDEITTVRDQNRRSFISLLMATGAAMPVAACTRANPRSQLTARAGEGLDSPLLWAAAWKQTAAEFAALCHQAYNLARFRVDIALRDRRADGRPLAVITDMDDTILHAKSYWGHLINQGLDFFDDEVWDEWLPKNLVTAVPGSLEFFTYCLENGVEIFYVTSRDQGERTRDYALQQLRLLGFPYADDEHLTVYRDTSDKSPTLEAVSSSYDVILMLGDNLNDYKRDYYVADVDERYALMERDRYDYGEKFILLPNPTDGHWVRAIFGDSEPAPTLESRRLLKEAATRVSWDGT